MKSFFFLFLICFISCNNKEVTGIKGDNNTGNSVIVGDNGHIGDVVNETTVIEKEFPDVSVLKNTHLKKLNFGKDIKSVRRIIGDPDKSFEKYAKVFNFDNANLILFFNDDQLLFGINLKQYKQGGLKVPCFFDEKITLGNSTFNDLSNLLIKKTPRKDFWDYYREVFSSSSATDHGPAYAGFTVGFNYTNKDPGNGNFNEVGNIYYFRTEYEGQNNEFSSIRNVNPNKIMGLAYHAGDFKSIDGMSTFIYPIGPEFNFFHQDRNNWKDIGSAKIKECFFLSPYNFPQSLRFSELFNVGTYKINID